MIVARIIEVLICASPFIGVPFMVWRDPADKYEAERKRRAQ